MRRGRSAKWQWSLRQRALRVNDIIPDAEMDAIENQRRRLINLYADLHIGQEEFVGRMRALEASLTDGLPQPTYFEADLVKFKGLLHDWKTLWDKATPEERKDIVASLFGEVRVRDKSIVSATLADQQYAPLIASSEAHRLRLVTPEAASDEMVGLAPPDGCGARITTAHLDRLTVYA